MKKDSIENSLIKASKESFWSKIIKLFIRNKQDNNIAIQTDNIKPKIDIQKEKFRQYITKVENDETQLIKLQKKYREGKIKEEELNKEQIQALCNLYDKQIEDLEKSNKIRRQRILQYKSKL